MRDSEFGASQQRDLVKQLQVPTRGTAVRSSVDDQHLKSRYMASLAAYRSLVLGLVILQRQWRRRLDCRQARSTSRIEPSQPLHWFFGLQGTRSNLAIPRQEQSVM